MCGKPVVVLIFHMNDDLVSIARGSKCADFEQRYLPLDSIGEDGGR
jgi:hypothetical protein